MNQFVSTRRQDLIPPCAKGCQDRTPTCRDHCQKEEFLRWRELMQKKKDDRIYRREASRIDASLSIRMRRGSTYNAKKGR